MASQKPCSFFAKGCCTSGAKCRFSHDPSLIVPLKSEAKAQASPCSFFAKGSCTSGAKCRFSHDPSLFVSPKSAATALAQAAPCSFFAKGMCTSGTKCRFSHDSSSVVPQKSEKKTKAQPAPCSFFARGGCTNGDKCRFSHDLSLVEMSSDDLGDSFDATVPCDLELDEVEHALDLEFSKMCEDFPDDESSVDDLDDHFSVPIGTESHPDLWYPMCNSCNVCGGYVHAVAGGCSKCIAKLRKVGTL